MKLLAVVSNFRQGWGGAPESVRLLAAVLLPQGVTVDVVDRGRFHADVGTLATLPFAANEGSEFDWAELSSYHAALVFGPWQNQFLFTPLLSAHAPPLIYLPRGGLAQIEFTRPRDIKKWPYLIALERRIIRAARTIVYSSDIEQSHTVWLARKQDHEIVIPDLFTAPEPLPRKNNREEDEPLSFCFMAEISPRKALVSLIEGFIEFAMSQSIRVRLTVAGSVRPGSERHYAEAQAKARSLPGNAEISFVGPVSNQKRPEFYRDCDVFVVSSLFESFGLTVLESLAAGCQVVAAPKLGVLQYLPANPAISRATRAGPHELGQALFAQAAILKDESTGRPNPIEYAKTSIAALNERAVDAWMRLLESAGQSN